MGILFLLSLSYKSLELYLFVTFLFLPFSGDTSARRNVVCQDTSTACCNFYPSSLIIRYPMVGLNICFSDPYEARPKCKPPSKPPTMLDCQMPILSFLFLTGETVGLNPLGSVLCQPGRWVCGQRKTAFLILLRWLCFVSVVQGCISLTVGFDFH